MFKLHKNVKKNIFLTDLEIVTPDPNTSVVNGGSQQPSTCLPSSEGQ